MKKLLLPVMILSSLTVAHASSIDGLLNSGKNEILTGCKNQAKLNDISGELISHLSSEYFVGPKRKEAVVIANIIAHNCKGQLTFQYRAENSSVGIPAPKPFAAERKVLDNAQELIDNKSDNFKELADSYRSLLIILEDETIPNVLWDVVQEKALQIRGLCKDVSANGNCEYIEL
jgi:hypothetical protein